MLRDLLGVFVLSAAIGAGCTLSSRFNLPEPPPKVLSYRLGDPMFERLTANRAAFTWNTAAGRTVLIEKEPPDIVIEARAHLPNNEAGLCYVERRPMLIQYDRPWTQLESNRLICVLTHELGHALGLEHSTNKASVMFPSLYGAETPDETDVQLLREHLK